MSSQKNKQRILRILKYIYRYTDEQHPVTNSDLVDMFTDVTVSGTRKTIKNDIDVLNSEGFNIIETKQHRDKCYFPGRPLDSFDVSLLINAVGTSRFISKERGNALIEKLMKLVSVHEAAAIDQYMYVPDLMKQENGQLYRDIDLIIEAINKGRKIKYQSFDYLPTKEKSLNNDGENCYLSPFAIISRDSRYYILGLTENLSEQPVIMVRIDLICNVEIIDEPVLRPEIFNVGDYLNKEIKKHEAETTEVILECANGQIQNVIDCFGNQIEPHPTNKGNFYVSVRAEDNPEFYAWVFKAAGEIRIVEPRAMQKTYRRLLRKGLKN